MNKASWIIVAIVAAIVIIGFAWYDRGLEKTTPSAGIANPASTNCVSLGGTLEIAGTAEGQVGYCHLPDGRVCEEWSLMRGGCAAPGASASSTAQ